jgi:hypothetical protein
MRGSEVARPEPRDPSRNLLHFGVEFPWKPMKATIKSPFPTVKETAAVLGVPASRVKKLVALVRANRTLSTKRAFEEIEDNLGYTTGNESVTHKAQRQHRASTKSESRRSARGKRSKARR